MSTITLPLIACCALSCAAIGAAAEAPRGRDAPETPAPLVEMAILLDVSGSMDGLIDQARSRIWTVVNELAATTRDGRTPDLRLALYAYGMNGQAEAGHMQQMLPLTDDLDAISAALFALKTSGSNEYCGQVLARAVDELAWSSGDSYRAIFIAGNESFAQGPVEAHAICQRAIARGIVVNTIHCGSEADGRNHGWHEPARLADGKSLNIDQNQTQVAIAAPQDQRIAELNARLNRTYLAYGQKGAASHQRQVAEDSNAAAASPSSVAQRAKAKSSKLYSNAQWDLVDAATDDGTVVEQMEVEALPAEMQAMTVAERKAYVAEKAAERATVQAALTKLVSERDTFIAAEKKRLAIDESSGFEAAAQAALQEQLAERGFVTAE